MNQPSTLENISAPPRVLRSHLPSLNGMRAVSILLVIAGHSAYVVGYESRYVYALSQLGVSIFFVISGLLITWLMIREREATGTLSLRNFYIRRFLRILPVFWLFLLTVSALKISRVIAIDWTDIFRAFTFTYNYMRFPPYAWWVGHSWSLSLEEQFYLVWPTLFVALRPRHAARLAAILVLSGPFLRIANYYLLPSCRGIVLSAFHTRIDILMAGCASAFFLESPAWKTRIGKLSPGPILAATSFFLLFVSPVLASLFESNSPTCVIARLALPTLDGVAIAVALLVVVAGKPDLAFRALNCGVCTHIGKLSYSIYIWQELFLVPFSATRLVSLPWRLIAVYAVSFCSYNFLERPLVNLRRRFRHGVAV